MLTKILEENPFLTQFDMARALEAKDPALNQNLERSVILRLLRMGNFIRKNVRIVPKDRNSEANI
jgi:hypothetical protein